MQEERLFASLAWAVQASQEDGSAPTGTVRTTPKISEDSRTARCPALSCLLPVSLMLPFRHLPEPERSSFPSIYSLTWNRSAQGKQTYSLSVFACGPGGSALLI